MGRADARAFRSSASSFVARRSGCTCRWTFFLVVVPLVNIGGTLPFTFNGIGLREAGLLVLPVADRRPREAAIAVGLLTSAVVLATRPLPACRFLCCASKANFTAEDAKDAEIAQRGTSASADAGVRARPAAVKRFSS